MAYNVVVTITVNDPDGTDVAEVASSAETTLEQLWYALGDAFDDARSQAMADARSAAVKS